jgi:sphingosine kinase
MLDPVIFSQEIISLARNRRFTVPSLQTQGILTADTLIWIENNQKHILELKDVVGVSYLPESSLAGFVVYAYPLVRDGILWKKRRRVLKKYRFACPDNETRSQWIKAINNTLRGLPVDSIYPFLPRHLHVLLNPASGKKKARKILQQVRSLWENSQIQITVTETSSAGEAEKFIQTLVLDKIDGLVIIGGDGTIYEVINGIMKRPDWETAITIPIGIIGAGTGNGLCKTILDLAGEPYDPIGAAFLIAKGKTRPLDLAVVQQQGRRYYSLLSLSWGFISDVDIESDRLRYLGSLKNTIYAILRILSLRTYKGRLFLETVTNSNLKTQSQCTSFEKCTICSESTTTPSSSFENTIAQETVPKTIADDFILVWAMNVIWAAYDLKAAPYAHLSDGTMDLLVIRRGISRWQLLFAFLRSANGKHIALPYVEYYKVRSFRLEPLCDRGILAIDGEQVEYSPLQLQVLRGMARIFGC